MGNAATTKKGDSSESGELSALKSTWISNFIPSGFLALLGEEIEIILYTSCVGMACLYFILYSFERI